MGNSPYSYSCFNCRFSLETWRSWGTNTGQEDVWVKLGYERNCGIVIDGLCTVNRCECYPRLIAAQQILIGCSSANVGASASGSFIDIFCKARKASSRTFSKPSSVATKKVTKWHDTGRKCIDYVTIW